MGALTSRKTIETIIKRRLSLHLKRLGYVKTKDGTLVPPDPSKESIRALHFGQRQELLGRLSSFVSKEWPRLKHHFADGKEVDVSRLRPCLELVSSDSWQARLFRLATLTWSVPVSPGYGRRLRFLVWDEHNERLIGIMALGDPVFNLRARDQYVGWTGRDRVERLVNVLDAYVLGAVPPYNMLLGGKLVACLVRTIEVRNAFNLKYCETPGIISKKNKNACLALVTTTSALGPSSVYNRLVLDGRPYFRPIGYTSGWGHFHVPADLFALLRELLKSRKHAYSSNYEFGDGPNWRLRAIRQALTELGMNPDLMRHGVTRQVFVCEFASNARDILLRQENEPDYKSLLSVFEVGELARTRWIEQRALRRQDYKEWRREILEASIRVHRE